MNSLSAAARQQHLHPGRSPGNDGFSSPLLPWTANIPWPAAEKFPPYLKI
jgi:hypothetical protein